jgi:phytanoyl-CoA hydroxylase
MTTWFNRARRLTRMSLSDPGETYAELKSVVNRRRFALTPEQWASWNDNGFILLPRFFSPEQMRAARAEIDNLWRDRAHSPLVIDVFGEPTDDGTVGASKRMRFADAEHDDRRGVYKLNDVFLERAWMRDLALDPRLAAILSQLLNDDPVICNSLLFERGSTQPLHFDTYYMPGKTTGGMTASWIALESGHPDGGPLVYIPGSHKIPAWRNSDGETSVRSPEEQAAALHYANAAVRDYGLREESFVAQEGDVFIWHEQLFHGGGRINDNNLTRRSLVTHYWRAHETDVAPVVRHGRGGGYYLARAHQSV